MNATIRYAIVDCSLGSMLIAASDKGICTLTLSDNPKELTKHLHRRFPKAEITHDDSTFQAVIDFVECPTRKFPLPIDAQGTPFQKSVWKALQNIPFGKTASYRDIAQRVGHPKAVRAVAQACGANPVAVAIPCHRVVRADGGISGYRWGVGRKKALLERERL